MGAGGGRSERWGPVTAMLAVDVALAVLNILVKKSLDEGMNCLVLITVRQVIATAFMAPIAYFKERKSRPKMTWWISVQFFFSALLGAFLTQYFIFLGLRYTNPTFSCAFLNLTPVFTFLMALSVRQERLSLKNNAGKAKLIATMICIGGVLVLILYRGPPLGGLNHATHQDHTARVSGTKSSENWTLGPIALLGGCVCWSAWFVLQARIGKQYPAVYSSTTLLFFIASLQAAALTLATTYRGGAAIWISSLRGRLQIATVVFAGVVGSGMCFLGMSWCIVKRGPVFTVAFSPLVQVVVALIDFILTRKLPSLGSVLGSVLVVLGLYLLLWGKSKESGICEVEPLQEAMPKTPKDGGFPTREEV